MTYQGFHQDNELPISSGQKIVIPAGVLARSSNPARREFVTKRKQTVTVHRCGNGMSIPNYIAYGDKHYRRLLEARGFDFTAIEKMREEDSPEYFHGKVALHNPMVYWAGTGGYWCWVDINDVLEGGE